MTPAEALQAECSRLLGYAAPDSHGAQSAVAAALGLSRSTWHRYLAGGQAPGVDTLSGWLAAWEESGPEPITLHFDVHGCWVTAGRR